MIYIYYNVEITEFGNGYTVYFEGDEIYFSSLKEAKEFIKENTEEV